jgi:hypothetical protein
VKPVAPPKKPAAILIRPQRCPYCGHRLFDADLPPGATVEILCKKCQPPRKVIISTAV